MLVGDNSPPQHGQELQDRQLQDQHCRACSRAATSPPFHHPLFTTAATGVTEEAALVPGRQQVAAALPQPCPGPAPSSPASSQAVFTCEIKDKL